MRKFQSSLAWPPALNRFSGKAFAAPLCVGLFGTAFYPGRPRVILLAHSIGSIEPRRFTLIGNRGGQIALGRTSHLSFPRRP